MTKATKQTLILTSIVCLIPIIAAILLYDQLPNAIATHWGVDGQPNGWSSKFVGTIVFPGILLIVNLLFPFLLKIDPKYKNMGNKVKSIVQWIIPATSLFASGITLFSALGANVRVEIYTPLFMGLLFIIIGNYLPKTGQSYTLGIKLPWTLHDEDNWAKTHRMAGFLWVLCGVLMIISAFFKIRMISMVVLLIVMVIVPCIYSYLLYAKKNK
ncbi:MAG: SdpI family protein [Lachnospiraceae bacterium]|nr:SdpI family protein [Lachnospiraceae bacterium]